MGRLRDRQVGGVVNSRRLVDNDRNRLYGISRAIQVSERTCYELMVVIYDGGLTILPKPLEVTIYRACIKP